MTKQTRQSKRKMKGYIRLIPNFLKLIGRLLGDPRVSTIDKAILIATISYTITPIDLIADFIPFFGLVDDIFLIALSLSRLLMRAGDEPLRQHWDGQGDIVALVNSIRQASALFLPQRVSQYLAGKIQNQ